MTDSNYSVEEEIKKQPRQRKDKSAGKMARLRNLPQYKKLSDAEFEEMMRERAALAGVSLDFEERIAAKLTQFEDDYDLSDMKINDMDTLRALIQAQISLEDYEQQRFRIQDEGLEDAYALEKLHKIMSDLRSDMSKFQNDLSITRKIRKSDKEESVLAYMSSLLSKAKKFQESKSSYIFCPKCDMLLGTVWTTYPDEERNKIALVCGRVMPDGVTTCGEKIIIGTKELLKNRGTNKKEITPESFL